MGAASLGSYPLEQFFDDDGQPLAGGKFASYAAGTSTPLATYTDSDLTVEQTNPIILDASGRPAQPIYLQPTGYKFILSDADDVVLVTFDNFSVPGWIFAENFGYLETQGGKDQTSGYLVLITDRLVTMDSTGGADPCIVQLPAAAEFRSELTIKNLGTVALAVTPAGADTIDTVAAAYTVAAGATPNFPTIIVASDGVSNWWVRAKFS